MRILNWFFHLKGGRQAITAFLLGSASTLALAPLSLWPILFLTFPPLLLFLDRIYQQDIRHHGAVSLRGVRRAAIVGWSFGFGYFLTGLYWIGFSFFVEAEKFALLMPLAVSLLPAGLAIIWALAFAIGYLCWHQGPARIILLSLILGMVELIRGFSFTGFPWNSLGYLLTSNEIMMQSAAVIGIYGLSFLSFMIYAVPALIFSPHDNILQNQSSAKSVIVFIASLYLAIWGWGAWRLSQANPSETHPDLEVMLVQPNVPQQDKVRAATRPKALAKVYETMNKALAQYPRRARQRLIIWPETAAPYPLNKSESFRQQLTLNLSEGDLLFTGAFYLKGDFDKKDAQADVFNSLFSLGEDGQILNRYDKKHLVPFGEYLPLGKQLKSMGLETLVRLPGGFQHGQGSSLLKVNDLPSFQALICYEVIFPQLALPSGRAEWLLNITNDGWFGKSSGPYQHFHHARVRAVEQGLPLVRVANGGISAIVDGYGRVTGLLRLGQQGVLVTTLPKPLSLTPYNLISSYFLRTKIMLWK